METADKLNMGLDDLVAQSKRGNGAHNNNGAPQQPKGNGVSGQKRQRHAEQPASTTIRVAKRVYVGNLSWQTSWQDLKDHFRQCGTVVHADVMREGTPCTNPTTHASQRPPTR